MLQSRTCRVRRKRGQVQYLWRSVVDEMEGEGYVEAKWRARERHASVIDENMTGPIGRWRERREEMRWRRSGRSSHRRTG